MLSRAINKNLSMGENMNRKKDASGAILKIRCMLDITVKDKNGK